MNNNPLLFTAQDTGSTPDTELVQLAVQGSKEALTLLLTRYQRFVYNVAWKMVLNPMDAEDVMQEVMIKVITNLVRFEQRSSFKTWLYRITVNHILTMKKKKMEEVVSGFDMYFDSLDSIPDRELTPAERDELREVIEEVRVSCTAGMLLCLDRNQRAVYILGELFGVDSNTGAEVFEITPELYRQRLSRARKDLYNWMNKRCGLVNTANPCKCPKKTKSFIDAGWVNPSSMVFTAGYKEKVFQIAERQIDRECDTVEELHREVFETHPLKEPPQAARIIEEILNNDGIKQLYSL